MSASAPSFRAVVKADAGASAAGERAPYRGHEGKLSTAERTRTRAERRAALAISKARRLWPESIADILTEEILSNYELLRVLGGDARVKRLIDAVLDYPET